MTAPFQAAGFPDSHEFVSGDPQDDPGTKPEVVASKAGPSLKTIGKGFWLTGPEEKVAKDIDQRWNAQNKGAKTLLARGEVNEGRRAGNPYIKLVPDTDQDTYRVYTPRGIQNAPPSLNKSDDLCVKVVSNIYADPPKPEGEPASDSDEDRSSAEFSTRVLMNETTESGMNILELIWDAEDAACSWGSGYVYAYVHPQGGGHRPKEVMAPPGATQLGPDGKPVLETVDEATGETVPIAGEPVIRYVGADGVSIVDDPNDALLEWLPKVCGDVLTPKQLRFLPETCGGIKDADGVLIAAFEQLGDLKAKFKNVAAMNAERLRGLVSYRPEIAKALLPKFAGNGEGTKGSDHDSSQGPPDDALCLTITGIRKGSSAYPLGAYVVMGGGVSVLHREEWFEEVRAKNGKLVKRAMDINVAQFRQFKDIKGQNPHGRGLVDRIGDGDPLVSFAIGAIVEYLHRVNNPHLFVPIGSGIQPKSLQLPRGTPIPFNPSGGGKPQQEEIAALPKEFMEFIQFIRADQDSVAGLQQAAQGVASASVQSGKHAQQIIEQALVALGGMKQGSDAGFMRLCRIVLQLIRKYYTTPQRIKIVGEDGAFKEREWMGADLGTTTDVKIQVGSSTMLTPSAKSAIALEKFQVGAITPEEFQRLEAGNTRALIGAQDNPHKTRIQRQVAEWNDGPPEDWQPPLQPEGVDPATGQPLPPEPDPLNPFADVRIADTLPDVAKARFEVLARANASTKYGTKPPEWRAHLDAELERMRQGAGVQTVQEQQQAMQAQAAQPQEAAVQQQEADAQVAEQQRIAKEQEKAAADEQARVAKAEDRQQVFAIEEFKAQKAAEQREREHQMALEMEQVKAAMVAQSAAAAPVAAPTPSAPAPSPYQVVLNGDITPVQEAVAATEQSIQRQEEMIKNLEEAVIALAEHATKDVPPPVVNVPAPIVNIEAPVVNVPAPVVNVPRQPRPQVTLEAPKSRPRKAKITGPDGKEYIVETLDADET